MKSKSNISINYIFNLTYQVFAMIAPLITTPYISRVLGAENVGVYSYTYAIITYFVLFANLGTHTYAIREISYVRDDIGLKSKIFYEVFFLRLTANMICIFTFVFLVINQFNTSYIPLFMIYIVYLFSHAFDISWFFQGMEQFKKTVFRNSFVKIISVLCIFLFVKKPSDLSTYIWCFAIPPLLGNISLWFFLPKYIQKVDFKSIKILRNFQIILQLFVPLIAIEIYTVVDRTMLGTMSSNRAELGFYEQSQKLIKLAFTFITSLSTVIMPKIAYDFQNGKNEKSLNKLICKIFNVVWFLCFPITIGLIGLTNNLVPWFFGNGYGKVTILLYIFSPVICLSGVSHIIYSGILLPTKKQNRVTVIIMIGALVNVGLNILLIPRLLSVGASIASVAAELIIFILCLWSLKKYANISNIIKLSIHYVFASIIMFGSIELVNFLNFSGWYKTITQIIIGFFIYILSLILMNDQFVKNYINKFLKTDKKRL